MNQKFRREFIKLLTNIKAAKIMDEFIEDILTPAEFEEIVTRWQIIKQLSCNIPQRAIAKQLSVSIAKITRGSRELQDEKGGFRKLLKIKNYLC